MQAGVQSDKDDRVAKVFGPYQRPIWYRSPNNLNGKGAITMTIEPYQFCYYREVFRVLEWRDGCVYRTEETGRYVRSVDIGRLGEDFIGCSISTKHYRSKGLNIKLWDFGVFGHSRTDVSDQGDSLPDVGGVRISDERYGR